MLELIITKRTDKRLLERMKIHYSKPKGFVGRNICYAIMYNNKYYGHIIGGSAVRFLPGRNEYLGITIKQLNNVCNNIFYNISSEDRYPKRNFTTFVLKGFMKKIKLDWENKYNDKLLGFETLVEKPRVGELYLKAGFIKVGETIGYQCKRFGTEGLPVNTDSWNGQRIWITDKDKLKPKNVLVYKL